MKVGKDLDPTIGFKQKRANELIWCSRRLFAADVSSVLVVFADFVINTEQNE